MNYKNDFQHSGWGFEDFLTLLAVANSLSLHLSDPLSRHRYPRMAFATEALWVIFCCVYTAAHTGHVLKSSRVIFRFIYSGEKITIIRNAVLMGTKTDTFSFQAKTVFLCVSGCAAAAGRWDKRFRELLFNTAS